MKKKVYFIIAIISFVFSIWFFLKVLSNIINNVTYRAPLPSDLILQLIISLILLVYLLFSIIYARKLISSDLFKNKMVILFFIINILIFAIIGFSVALEIKSNYFSGICTMDCSRMCNPSLECCFFNNCVSSTCGLGGPKDVKDYEKQGLVKMNIEIVEANWTNCEGDLRDLYK